MIEDFPKTSVLAENQIWTEYFHFPMVVLVCGSSSSIQDSTTYVIWCLACIAAYQLTVFSITHQIFCTNTNIDWGWQEIIYFNFYQLIVIQNSSATFFIFVNFCLIRFEGSMPSPQSGARMSLSGLMNFRASVTLFLISSSVSILDLATVTQPRMT